MYQYSIDTILNLHRIFDDLSFNNLKSYLQKLWNYSKHEEL